MEEEIIVCPNCGRALKVPVSKLGSKVKCPCTYQFKPEDELCVVDEQRKEAALAHAQEVEFLE
jgi:rRNA maturation protein Nop10